MLGRNDVPCAVVNSVQGIFDDAQLAATGILQTMDDEALGSLRYLQPGFFSDGAQPISPRRAPHLGEHGREILAELGVAEVTFSGSSQTVWSVIALNKMC